ncbi:hypothetical protein QR680_005656 [Steinernema hermaphroditum]|uniref:Glycosyltransferase family 92 protein n=1 Tax=Steinernema hermaphroditum TaxID=289476 RepID=A0AA39HV33_9BILA|nr:hypothetical protein QR680_005656 [Steinernema hermaphroditum]
MQRGRIRRLLVLAFFLLLVLSFFGLLSSWKRRRPEDLAPSLGEDSVLLLGAFRNASTVRILVLSRCIGNATKFLVRVDSQTRAEATVRPLQGRCGVCFWNPYVVEAVFGEKNLSSTAPDVSLYWKGRYSLVPYVEAPRTKRVAFCVEPLFWFSGVRELRRILKRAKEAGDVDVFVYLHSASLKTWKVLRRYEKERIVFRVPFDLQTAAVRMDLDSWNSLALEDCRLRAGRYSRVEAVPLASRRLEKCFQGCFSPSSAKCFRMLNANEWIFVERRSHPFFVL